MSSVNQKKAVFLLCSCKCLGDKANSAWLSIFCSSLSVALIHARSPACSGLLAFLGISVLTLKACMDV